MTLPTLLTLLRVALIPFFVVVFLLPWVQAHLLATALFGVAALTDWLDGYLARKLGQMSTFGAFLDPVADKLIVVAALVLLVQAHPTPLMAVATLVIIIREVTISALREWMAHIGQHSAVAVSGTGKLKTTTQMIAVLLLLYRDPIGFFPTFEVGLFFLVLAAALAVGSMAQYLKVAWPLLMQAHQKT